MIDSYNASDIIYIIYYNINMFSSNLHSKIRFKQQKIKKLNLVTIMYGKY